MLFAFCWTEPLGFDCLESLNLFRFSCFNFDTSGFFFQQSRLYTKVSWKLIDFIPPGIQKFQVCSEKSSLKKDVHVHWILYCHVPVPVCPFPCLSYFHRSLHPQFFCALSFQRKRSKTVNLKWYWGFLCFSASISDLCKVVFKVREIFSFQWFGYDATLFWRH